MARWSQLRGFDPPPPGVRCWCWRCRGPGAAGGGPALCPPRSRAAGRGRTPAISILRINMVWSIVKVSRKTIVVNAKINMCLK